MIEFEQVGFGYAGDAPVLDAIDFRIGGGERVVLLGANGSGKSTLLRLAAGLEFATAGVVRYRGTPLTSDTLDDARFRRRMRDELGIVFQHPDAMLFNASVRDEIAFGLTRKARDDTGAVAVQWASRLGLERHLDRAPFRLSGGEKQRLALACVLACEPDVLLLDEPVANLDPRTADWLVDYLAGLDGRTLWTSTQNLSTAAAFGDRALLLGAEGRLIFDGPLHEVLNNPALLVEAGLR